MIRWVLAFGVACLSGSLLGAATSQLQPESSPYSFFYPEYRAAIMQAFAPAMGGDPRMHMMVLPSFQPEYVIGIIDGEKPFVRVITLSDQIWGVMHEGVLKPGEVPETFVTTFRISPELHSQIEAYTCETLKGARYKESNTIGLDGVTFHFSAWCGTFGSPAAAKAWSPSPDSSAGQLVSIYEHLKELSALPESERSSQLDLLDKEIKRKRTALSARTEADN